MTPAVDLPAAAPTAVFQARGGVGPHTTLVIGDSVLSGLARSYGATACAALGARHPFLLDAAGCRRLITPGCRLGSGPPAQSALSVLTAHAGEPIRVLVVGAGYNDTSTGASGVDAAIDRIMAAARDQGIEHVVWLTYREAGDDAHRAQYRGHNDVLRAKAAADPSLLVADWAAVSSQLPSSWFSADGLHLGAASAQAIAELIADAIDEATGAADASPADDIASLAATRPAAGEAHLTVLLPARNAAHLLPEWLDNVAAYADAVIALDDGSTDETRRILKAHPLVTRVLTAPVRPTYRGWDDLGNRQRLVDAARGDGARWLLFLDADERIDHGEAKDLRRFLETEAQPGFAYGFEVFRMVEDERHHDPRSLWVFRLFSADDADTPLGSRRLHFVPVPGGIPRQRWLFTSIRIQHSGSLTAAHRQARFDKYLQADPDNQCQADYTGLLTEPVVSEWLERPAELPVLLGVEGRYADRQLGDHLPATPAITAVVIAQDDVGVIDRSLRALVDQQVDDEFEIVVVCSGSDGTSDLVRRRYPGVRCVQLPARALPGEARNAGLWMARGEYVSFPGSHVWLQPGSLQARLDAHDEGWDLVTGAVVNGNTTRAGWASYLLDHAAQPPTRAPGEFSGVPGHASYVARDVLAVGGFPEDMRAGEDTVVNRRLYFAGKRTWFCTAASFAHASPSTGIAHLLRHHFQRGRALGRIIRGDSDKSRVALLRSTKTLPRRRLRHVDSSLQVAGDELRTRYRGIVRAYVAAGALAAATGTWYQLLVGVRTATAAVCGRLPAATSGPLLVISGRPGEAATGLLAAGSSRQAAGRLLTFARYARTVCPVRPALAPIVTSATVTSEHAGTHTVELAQTIVDAYLRAARDVGASLLLQVQPGRAALATVLERWADVLAEPDVGVFFDLRPEVAFAGQGDELGEAVRLARRLGGEDTTILVRGVETAPPGVTVVPHLFELRRPGTAYPHDALAAEPGLEVLVYQ